MGNLQGRIALVTGASQGIGRAVALELARAGATVAVAARNEAKLAEVVAEIEAASGQAAAFALDVASEESIKSGAKAALERFGKVEILVNNAGITRDAQLHRMKPDQWAAVINTNLGSLFNVTRQVIEGMRARKFGRIVNISSINGQKGQFGQVNYSAAKAGDIGFTKALALENAKGGITVNVICPGYINTEMVQAVPKEVLEKSILPQIPINRLGEPEEIARAVVFLAADDAGAITGSTLTINGGQYMV
jgi:acetoacetyl-CoA reductase